MEIFILLVLILGAILGGSGGAIIAAMLMVAVGLCVWGCVLWCKFVDWVRDGCK